MKQNAQYWIYGKHCSLAVIKNKKRNIHKILITEQNKSDIPDFAMSKVAIKNARDIEDAVKSNSAVIQGIAVMTDLLPQPSLSDFLKHACAERSVVLILDQLSDPQNIGAIFRSAAAFNASAIITTTDNCPKETASLVKTAAGAFEVVPFITTVNLSQAITKLKESGYWIIGLDGEATENIKDSKVISYEKIALVLGAEGKGMRPLTKKQCDCLVKIPISGNMESLNVSNAAAIALYEVAVK